jgi:hypothetical protein
MNNQAPASFAGGIAKMHNPANVHTTGRAPAAAGKTTYAEPTCAEYEAMLDGTGTTPSPTFNQGLAEAHSWPGPDPRIRHRTQIGMFRPIRMDHTNCLQVAIKTLQFLDCKEQGQRAPSGRKQYRSTRCSTAKCSYGPPCPDEGGSMPGFFNR